MTVVDLHGGRPLEVSLWLCLFIRLFGTGFLCIFLLIRVILFVVVVAVRCQGRFAPDLWAPSQAG